MKVLVVGSGGREHALADYLSRSRHNPKIYVAPGNAGTGQIASNVAIAADDIDALLNFAKTEDIDLTVVGPEVPLTLGIVDAFRAAALKIVGPTQAAARLEGSKAFSKAFMARHGIPTAHYQTFQSDAYDEAVSYVKGHGAPIVIKASGLAAGKGAVVCEDLDAALSALEAMMRDHSFGSAGDEVVVESFMEGEEASVFALCDGKEYVLLPSAQDHKRVGDGDTGPNTGGMGAYSPAPIMRPAMLDRVRAEIIEPTLAGMRQEGTPYTGFLYVGLMISAKDGARVVEYNCRLGDPETQVVLPLLETDAVDLFQACALGNVTDAGIVFRNGAAATVVMASAGYPGTYPKGIPIEGIESETPGDGRSFVYHAGTRRRDDGSYETNGGRVLAVTALGEDLEQALDTAYARVASIRFEGAHYRRDIGAKGLAHRGAPESVAGTPK